MTPDQASDYILFSTKVKRESLERLLKNTVELQNYSEIRLYQILNLLEELSKENSKLLNILILQAYKDGYATVYNDLINVQGPPIDIKVVEVLVKDTLRDFKVAIEQSKSFIKSVFKLAKQDILSEVRISEIALERIMEQGTFRDITKQTIVEMEKAGSTANTRIRNLSESEIKERFNRAKRSLLTEGKIPQYLKTKVLKRVESKLREGKFITILTDRLDSFGKRIPYTYSLDYYTSLVAKTRFADSQVQGSLNAGEKLGVKLYLVSDHNTTTEKCKQYEDKYLSPDPKLWGKYFEGKIILPLTKESTPIYHPNCKHRLIIVPITSEEYYEILRSRNAA